MDDITSLSIKVDSTQVKTSTTALNDLGRAGENAERGVKKVESASGAMSASLKATAVAAAGLFASLQLIDKLKDISMLAARYETLGVVMKVVGNNVGYTGKETEKYTKELQKNGIAMMESRETLTRMAAAHIDLSKASALARIAQDAAVIGNTNSSEAFSRMIQGIQRGETEIMKTIGLNVDFMGSQQKLAKQLGITTQQLTPMQKVLSNTNEAFRAGVSIAGSYEAAMGTAGKMANSLKRYIDDIKISLGAAFGPAMTLLIDQLTESLKETDTQLKNNKKAVDEWGEDFRRTLIDLEIHIHGIAILIDLLGGTLTTAGKALFAFGNAIGNDNSVAQYNKMIELNKMFEERAIASAVAIEKLRYERDKDVDSIRELAAVEEDTKEATRMRLALAAQLQLEASEEVQKAEEETAKATKESAKLAEQAAKEYANFYQSTLDRLLPLVKEQKDYNAALAVLKDMDPTQSTDAYNAALANLEASLTVNIDKAKELQIERERLAENIQLGSTGPDELRNEASTWEIQQQNYLIQLQDEYNEKVDEQVAIQKELGTAYGLSAQEAEKLKEAFATEQLKQLIFLKGGIQAALLEMEESFDRFSDLAYEVMYDLHDAFADSFKAIFTFSDNPYLALIDRIQEKISQLQYGSLSEGTQQMEALQVIYDRTLRSAMDGNEEAFESYMSNLDLYLAKAKETMSPNDYAVLYNQTMKDLNSMNEAYIDETESQWDRLGDIWDDLWDKIKDKALDTLADIIADDTMSALGSLFSSSGSSSSSSGSIISSIWGGITSWFSHDGGKIKESKFADGGKLVGGSGVKDDLYLGIVDGVAQIAMGGEYIVNAEATSKNLPLLEAINSKTYASGGYVGSTPMTDMVREFTNAIGEMIDAVIDATDTLVEASGRVSTRSISTNLLSAAIAAKEASIASEEAAADFARMLLDGGGRTTLGYTSNELGNFGYTSEDFEDAFGMMGLKDLGRMVLTSVATSTVVGLVQLGSAYVENLNIVKNMRETIGEIGATLGDFESSVGDFGSSLSGLEAAAENAFENTLSTIEKAAEGVFGDIDFGGSRSDSGSNSDSSSSGSGIGGFSGADLGKGSEDWATGGLLIGGSGVKDDLYLGNIGGTDMFAMGGEYIVNAEATSKNLPLLEAINSKKFASGGIVVPQGGDMSSYMNSLVPQIYNSLVSTTASEIASIVEPLTNLIDYAFLDLSVTVGEVVGDAVNTMFKTVSLEDIALLTNITTQLITEIQTGYQTGTADLTSTINEFLGAIETASGGIFNENTAGNLNAAFNEIFMAQAAAEAAKAVLNEMQTEALEIYAAAAEAIGPTSAYRTTTDQGSVTPDSFTAIEEFMASVGDFLQESSLNDYQNDLLSVAKAYDTNIAALRAVGASEEDVTMAIIARGVALEQVINKEKEMNFDIISDIMYQVNQVMMSDAEIAIQNINKQYDEHIDTLKAAGAAISEINKVELARIATIKEIISDTMGSIVRQAEEYANAVKLAEGNIQSAYQKALSKQETAQEKVNSLLEKSTVNLESFSKSIDSFLNSLNLKTLESSFENLKAQFMVTASAAAGGDATAMDNLIAQANSVLSAAESNSSSKLDYDRTVALVKSQVQMVRGSISPGINTDLADAQKELASTTSELAQFEVLAIKAGITLETAADKTAKLLLELDEAYNEAFLNNINAQRQYQAALSLTNGLTFETATALSELISNVNALRAAMIAYNGSLGSANAVHSSTSFDPANIMYLTSQLGSAFDILAEIEKYKTSITNRVSGSFAVGTDYVPYDMTANIHQGERIVPAAYNRSDKTNAELLAEIAALRKEMNAVMYQVAKNTLKTADYAERQDGTVMKVSVVEDTTTLEREAQVVGNTVEGFAVLLENGGTATQEDGAVWLQEGE